MLKLLVRLVLALTLSLPALATAQSSAPRERVNIDRDWRFAFGDPDPRKDFGFGVGYFIFAKAGNGNGPASTKFDDRAWRRLDLPHDWVAELPFDRKGSTSHGSRTIGANFPEHNIGWYRKTLDLSEKDRGRRIAVEFDGVYRDSEVWFNGFYIGEEHSGYSSFRYDLTDYVNYNGPNVLVVRVNAAREEGWFYEGAGIYRHVWLTKTDPLHVGHWGTFVTSKVGAGSAAIAVRTTVANDGDSARHFTIEQTILDPAGKRIATGSTPGDVAERTSMDSATTLTVAHPQLWSIETPAMHRLVTTIRDGDRIVDRYETPFGIRTVRFDPDTGFWLNGRNIKLKGTNNHQDHAGIGVAIPDAVQAYRLARLKAFGSNAYRASHNPPAPELLDAADRLGMLVIDENRQMGTTPEITGQLRRMVERDRNHPSVVLWSVGNEEWEIEGKPVGALLTRNMQAEVKRLDPSRRSTVASSGNDNGSSTASDVVGFNYRTQHDVDGFHRQYPDKPTVMSEEGSTHATRGVYVTDPKAVSVAAYDRPRVPVTSSSIQEGWQAVVARPWMSGMFIWTGFDYGGETEPYGWPAVSSQLGMLDTTGAFKDTAWYLKAQWTDTPVIHILPHWNWPNRVGEKIPVWVSSNAAEVELFLDGKSQGRRPMPPQGHVEWAVAYHPGTLVARGYTGGAETVSATVETTGPVKRLAMAIDRSTVAADGRDVAVVTVGALDAAGRAVPTADDAVDFDVTGPGTIIGIGNGDPGNHEIARRAPAIVPIATTDWKMADVGAGSAIDVAALHWRDPFQWHPASEQPAETDAIVLRGTVALPEGQGQEATLFLPDLAPGQAVYIDGKDRSGAVRRDATGPSLPLDPLRLAAGAHQILILVRAGGVGALKRLKDIGVGGSNVAWLQLRTPPAPWRLHLFNGSAQVLVQSSGPAGRIVLTARPTGLPVATAAIDARP